MMSCTCILQQLTRLTRTFLQIHRRRLYELLVQLSKQKLKAMKIQADLCSDLLPEECTPELHNVLLKLHDIRRAMRPIRDAILQSRGAMRCQSQSTDIPVPGSHTAL